MLASAVGVTAGAINGVALNQLAVVKYHVWNDHKPANFMSAARRLYAAGGLRAFYRGARVTGVRDTVFGVIYEVGRTVPAAHHQCPQMVANLCESEPCCLVCRPSASHDAFSSRPISSSLRVSPSRRVVQWRVRWRRWRLRRSTTLETCSMLRRPRGRCRTRWTCCGTLRGRFERSLQAMRGGPCCR